MLCTVGNGLLSVIVLILMGGCTNFLQLNPAPQPPSGWNLVWSDEFDGPAGETPDPATWTPEIGDGTAQGIPGWGNNELEYYTDSPDNGALDGQGNLLITARETDPASAPRCYYGVCRYTSARLISAGKIQVQYGRIEARIQLPTDQGIWPAFWMLGNDIGTVGWPQCGEIDIMENVGHEPRTVHGTLHGPGYAGAAGVSGKATLDTPLSAGFHTYALEWEPKEIRWYIDDLLYHSATPEDLPSGAAWVFDHPFFLILNVAVGGNWPGPPDDTTVFPQTMRVDYVRVYSRPRLFLPTIRR